MREYRTPRSDKLCECGCGEHTFLDWPTGPPRRFLFGHHTRGIHNPRYKGECHPALGPEGRHTPTHTHTNRAGYVQCYVPDHPHASHNGYVFLHRLVMERAIGRYLLLEERVHHLPDAPLDTTDPTLLRLYANDSEHMRLAHGTNGNWSRAFAACIECGSTAIPYAGKGRCRNCYMRQKRSEPGYRRHRSSTSPIGRIDTTQPVLDNLKIASD